MSFILFKEDLKAYFRSFGDTSFKCKIHYIGLIFFNLLFSTFTSFIYYSIDHNIKNIGISSLNEFNNASGSIFIIVIELLSIIYLGILLKDIFHYFYSYNELQLLKTLPISNKHIIINKSLFVYVKNFVFFLISYSGIVISYGINHNKTVYFYLISFIVVSIYFLYLLFFGLIVSYPLYKIGKLLRNQVPLQIICSLIYIGVISIIYYYLIRIYLDVISSGEIVSVLNVDNVIILNNSAKYAYLGNIYGIIAFLYYEPILLIIAILTILFLPLIALYAISKYFKNIQKEDNDIKVNRFYLRKNIYHQEIKYLKKLNHIYSKDLALNQKNITINNQKIAELEKNNKLYYSQLNLLNQKFKEVKNNRDWHKNIRVLRRNLIILKILNIFSLNKKIDELKRQKDELVALEESHNLDIVKAKENIYLLKSEASISSSFHLKAKDPLFKKDVMLLFRNNTHTFSFLSLSIFGAIFIGFISLLLKQSFISFGLNNLNISFGSFLNKSIINNISSLDYGLMIFISSLFLSLLYSNEGSVFNSEIKNLRLLYSFPYNLLHQIKSKVKVYLVSLCFICVIGLISLLSFNIYSPGENILAILIIFTITVSSFLSSLKDALNLKHNSLTNPLLSTHEETNGLMVALVLPLGSLGIYFLISLILEMLGVLKEYIYLLSAFILLLLNVLFLLGFIYFIKKSLKKFLTLIEGGK